MRRAGGEQIRRLGIDVDPRTTIGTLPIGLHQLIDIARVLFSGARIVILDEPTSALSPPEIERLFGALRRLRDDGRSFVFISHFLDDVLKVSDTVTVFRNGRKVLTTPAAETDKAALIERMIGAGHGELAEVYSGEVRVYPRDGTTVHPAPQARRAGGVSREVAWEGGGGRGRGRR